MLLLFWRTPNIAPPAPIVMGGSGGGFYDPGEEYFNSFEYWDNKQKAFEAQLLIYELGDTCYEAARQVSFEDFARRTFQASYESPTSMRLTLQAIDASRAEIKRTEERAMAVKAGLAVGVSYVLYRAVILLL